MKKKLLCLLITLVVVSAAFVGCSGNGNKGDSLDKVDGAITLNLYGITGESTTEEAILKVQDAINAYTEGAFGTRIILHLYTEDKYYDALEAKFAAIESTEYKNPTINPGESYPTESETQLDIFMVQGAHYLNRYEEKGYLNDLNVSISEDFKLLSKYISDKVLNNGRLGVEVDIDTKEISDGTYYGISNNYVYGEYTYLLVNKELASKYYYSASDVDSLAELENFLDDAKNHSDYITLYNAPVVGVDYLSKEFSFLGGGVNGFSYAYTRLVPRNMLSDSLYLNFRQSLYDFKAAGYITDGDYYKMPTEEDGSAKKVAAAFIKGNASIPEQYSEDYFVIPYLNPIATYNERRGTMFCVSTFTESLDRSMEIVNALQTDPILRNIFQYGVEGVHYTEDEYTGIVDIISDDYSMHPEDTGNLFILKPNSDMSKEMLALAENDWELGKQQLRDTIFSPYTMFDFKVITEDNYYKVSPTYIEKYKAAYEAASLEEGFDPSKFVFEEEYAFEFTDVIMEELTKLSNEILVKIDNFVEYEDEFGNTVTLKSYINRTLRKEFEANEYYKMWVDIAKNPDSGIKQYNDWYDENGPKDENSGMM